MSLPLHKKIAIVTGASRGIGLAIASALTRAGAKTYLVARNHVTLRAACEHINAAPVEPFLGSVSESPLQRAIPLPCNVSLPESWDFILRRINDDPHILVNAAGIAQNSLLYRTTPEDIDSLLNVNLRATILGCRAVGKRMIRLPFSGRQDGHPSIINVASVMAMRGRSGASVYAATKAGILGLTTSLSQEFGHFGIRVNAIVPGYIDTDMLKGQDLKKLAANIPLGRLGRVDEVADAAVFLACNTYANNCHLTLDGGLSGSV